MDYLEIVKREYMKIKHTQFKEHVDITISLVELGLETDMLNINSDIYFKKYAKLYNIQQRLIQSVETIIDEEIQEKDFPKVIQKLLRKKNTIPSKMTFMFITVRPEDGKYDPNQFVETVLRSLQGRQYEMVVEQAGASNDNILHGIHIHAIVNRIPTIAVGEDKQGLFRKLSKIGNTKIDWHIEDHRQDKQNYMGKEPLTEPDMSRLDINFDWKDTDEKCSKLIYDHILRSQYDIPHYYEQI